MEPSHLRSLMFLKLRNAPTSAILPGYYLRLETFPGCSGSICPALEKCLVPEACPGMCQTQIIFILTIEQEYLANA
jgi:hypothetical protein